MRLRLIDTVVGLCLLAACSSPTPVSVSTATPPLIVTSGGPTPTTADEVSVPTTPEPTSTTAPTLPAPTAQVVTPQSVTQFGPTNFPDNVDPLTGLQVARSEERRVGKE